MSGVFLFLLIPFALWVLGYSLTESGFEQCARYLEMPFTKVMVWLFCIPFCFHLLAGVRHLLSDMHIGDSLQGGRVSSYLTFIVSIIFIILAGIWIW
jgi:succinate dehydrogenase / fumarate reductase cytochrome b subunit